MRAISQTFRSVKIRNTKLITSSSKPRSSASTVVQAPEVKSKAKPRSGSWSVYLILSTNHPIKTYVGVTTNFPRRLKQHNGELKGGAKASRAGRPWICACLIHGFVNRSEACEFESKWKSISRKLPRKKRDSDPSNQKVDASLQLLQHREAALDRVRRLFAWGHLHINWKLDSSRFMHHDMPCISQDQVEKVNTIRIEPGSK